MNASRGAMLLFFGLSLGGFLTAAWGDEWKLAGQLGSVALVTLGGLGLLPREA